MYNVSDSTMRIMKVPLLAQSPGRGCDSCICQLLLGTRAYQDPCMLIPATTCLILAVAKDMCSRNM